jgi:hypothetical protein
MTKRFFQKSAAIIAAGAAIGLLLAAAPSSARYQAGSAASASCRAGAAIAGGDRSSVQLARADDDEGEPYENSEHGKRKHHHGKHHGGEAEGQYAGPFFRPVDSGYFSQCYGGGDISSLPPGLQKHVERTGHLPPGLEKQLARNGHLPPGLEKRMSPASPCVLQRIGPLPPNSRLYMLGRDAYLINYHTRSIIDILRGAY